MSSVLAESIPDVVSASVTVETVRAGRAGYRMVAASGAIAARIDQAQYEAEAGPCVQALATGQDILLAHLPAEDWPAFSAEAQKCGVDWSLSIPMRNGEQRGVLNVYASGPGRLDEQRHVQPAKVFARYAATILAAHTRYVTAITEVEQMQEAMASRATIEQAKGMIMLRERCSADEAFQMLVHTSQRSHLKLREVADQLITSIAGSGPAGTGNEPRRNADG